MPFNVPSLTQLIDQAATSFDTHLPGADARLRRSSIGVSARTMAGLAWGEYGYLNWVREQLLPDSAEQEYLERWAAILRIQRRGAAPAAGTVVLTGTDGVLVASGTPLVTADGVSEFLTQADVTIASGTASVAIVAESGGAVANLDAGVSLQLAVALAGVDAAATIGDGGTTGGEDIESDTLLRGRVLARIRQPPQGGAGYDYVAWAKGVPGVTRVWVFPLNRGAGTVDVAFTMDGRANIIPLPADVDAVQGAIDAPFHRPVTADSIVFAPAATPLDIGIRNLVPDSTALRAAVTASLDDLLRIAATPGGATVGDSVSRARPGGTVYLEQIYATIAAVPGVEAFDITSPGTDITAAHGHILTLGTVSFA